MAFLLFLFGLSVNERLLSAFRLPQNSKPTEGGHGRWGTRRTGDTGAHKCACTRHKEARLFGPYLQFRAGGRGEPRGYAFM